jgi:MFS family permease
MLKDTEAHLPQRSSPPRQPGDCLTSPSRARYYVLVLSFIVGLVMYLDRACMGAATPMIMREFRLDKITMGWSASAFNWTYALFQIPGGWLADRLGSRVVLAGAIMWWSIFTAATGRASSAISLAVTRGLFGMGEAAAWPAASRSLLRWLPVEQRIRPGFSTFRIA